MKILIGCLSYNTKLFLDLYLKSLHNSLIYAQVIKNIKDVFKIVVIDNGSTDDTKEFTDKYNTYPYTYCYRNKSNLGVAAGWNQLIKHGLNEKGELDYDYYLICNSDIYWSEKSIYNFIQCLEQDKLKEYGWVSFFQNDYKEFQKTGVQETVNFERLYWSIRPHADSVESIDQLESLLDTSYGPWNGLESFSTVLEGQYGVQLKQMHPKATCFALSKECIKRVGLFDELNCPTGIHEDADLCRRIKDQGDFKFGAAYGAYIHHFSCMTRTKNEIDNNGKWVNEREKAYVDKWNAGFKLDIGSGSRPKEGPGWYHMDIDSSFPHVEYIHDCSTILPFKDNSLDEIYCSNNLEHIEWRKIKQVLKDWYRCLKPNGKIEIRVPDFNFAVNMYTDRLWSLNYQDRSERNLLHLLMGGDTKGIPHLHKSLFDFVSLNDLLTDVGFKNILNISESGSWELRVTGYKLV